MPRRPVRRIEAATTWLSLAVLTICFGGCSGKSNASAPSADAFARIWSDCSAYCQKQESCGVISAAACAVGCQPFDMTSQAIVSAGLAPDVLGRCQSAHLLADVCQAGLSCREFTEPTSPCDEQLVAANANCSLIDSTVDLHARAHPVNQFFGVAAGRFTGSNSGNVRCWIYPWGTARAELTNDAGYVVNVAGALTGSSLAMSGRGKANDGAETITVEGMLSATGTAAGDFVVNGSWQSDNGSSGTFELQ